MPVRACCLEGNTHKSQQMGKLTWTEWGRMQPRRVAKHSHSGTPSCHSMESLQIRNKMRCAWIATRRLETGQLCFVVRSHASGRLVNSIDLGLKDHYFQRLVKAAGSQAVPIKIHASHVDLHATQTSKTQP